MTGKLTLESPVVQETKAKYERSTFAKRCKIPFDVWFERFQRGEKLEVIALELSIERAMVLRSWEYFFKFFLAEERKDSMRRLWKKEREKVLARIESELPMGSAIRAVLDLAHKAGCTTELITEGSRVFMEAIRVEGQRVAIYDARKTVEKKRHVGVYFSPGRHQVARSRVVAFVIHTNPATIFAVRSYILWKSLFIGNMRPWVTLKVSAKRPRPLNNPRRRIDLWEYEGEAAEKTLASLRKTEPSSARAE